MKSLSPNRFRRRPPFLECVLNNRVLRHRRLVMLPHNRVPHLLLERLLLLLFNKVPHPLLGTLQRSTVLRPRRLGMQALPCLSEDQDLVSLPVNLFTPHLPVKVNGSRAVLFVRGPKDNKSMEAVDPQQDKAIVVMKKKRRTVMMNMNQDRDTIPNTTNRNHMTMSRNGSTR